MKIIEILKSCHSWLKVKLSTSQKPSKTFFEFKPLLNTSQDQLQWIEAASFIGAGTVSFISEFLWKGDENLKDLKIGWKHESDPLSILLPKISVWKVD